MEEERTEEQLNSTEVTEDSRGVEVPGSAQDERLGLPFPQIISRVGVLRWLCGVFLLCLCQGM